MDDFVVLSQYDGTQEIAQIQKVLNAKFAQEMNQLIPTDGVYGRELNKALIFMFQRTEGLSVADALKADGYFGPGTQAKAPTITKGNENYFVTILQYALYCNGYTNVSFTGIYDSVTETAVANFGKSMEINTNLGEEVDLDTWIALLISSGNPNRTVTGCDAAQRLSLEDAQILKAKGYEIVGRYLIGNFATSVEELTNILTGGLNVFPIYETGSYEKAYFTPKQGTNDAVNAVVTCENLLIPQGTRIYFTVDFDMEGVGITDLVIPYFEAIYNKFNEAHLNYNIGIYGSRNVCSKVIEAGYAQYAFVDGASTGYSGNMGFNMPENWAFNQIKEGVTVEGIQVDNDQVSGANMGFRQLINKSGEVVVSNESSNKESGIEDLLEDGAKELGHVMSLAMQDFMNGFAAIFYPKGEEINFEEKIGLGKYLKKIETGVLSTKFYSQAYPLFKDKAYIRFEGGFSPAVGCSSIKTILCDVQEVIDKFNTQYDNILNDADKFAYIMTLKETINPSIDKDKIYSLESGIYRVRARRTLKNELSPDAVRYYIDIYERPEGQDIGVTNEQIEELKKFVNFLERDDVKEEIYEHEKSMSMKNL